MNDKTAGETDPRAFWEDVYLTRRTEASGNPSRALVRYAGELPAGTALDLGSSNGDDVIWLAARGWQAKGIDISPTATARAAKRASDLGVADRARFEARDLARDFPGGTYDLVTAFYFQSSVYLPRADILRKAAGCVAPGGHILVVAHAVPPPWSTSRRDPADNPTVEGELEALAPDPAGWIVLEAEIIERMGRGPDGTEALLKDTVVMLRRRD